MALSYANLTSRVLQFLQDTGAAIYDSTELGMWIEGGLKQLSRYSPVLLDVIYQVESRTGTDVTGAASTLTDATKASSYQLTPPTRKWCIILPMTPGQWSQDILAQVCFLLAKT